MASKFNMTFTKDTFSWITYPTQMALHGSSFPNRIALLKTDGNCYVFVDISPYLERTHLTNHEDFLRVQSPHVVKRKLLWMLSISFDVHLQIDGGCMWPNLYLYTLEDVMVVVVRPSSPYHSPPFFLIKSKCLKTKN
jgi:hypothetical protein